MKIIILSLSLFLVSNDNFKETYIEKWKELSIIESDRTGIPVSIILGQAILESNYGNSELAIKARNHFGIKCKKEWEGHFFYKEDDDFNNKGKLIESCFRSYNMDMDSFIDHSHFLLGKECYKSLLLNDRKDYKSWANGLHQCGYATDKKYAQKLIKIIETHSLWQLD
mgnify:FL=1|tara:strand:- start:566 stop:1069 length:504 start_codon:yes stop_codon:yes gene_type:complete